VEKYRIRVPDRLQVTIWRKRVACWIPKATNTHSEYVILMGEDRGVHRVLVGKPEGNRSLGRPGRRWEDNIKMDLQEVGWGRGDWMELAQDRDSWRALVGTVRAFRVP
jgi:hypothetical protein